MTCCPTTNLRAKLVRFMDNANLPPETVSKKAKVHLDTINSVLGLESISLSSYDRLDKFLERQKPKAKVSETFKKFEHGYVFLYPDDSGFLPEYEKELVRNSGHGLLKRGSQYYCEGKFFFRLEGLKTFEETNRKPTEEELKDIFR